MARAQRSSPVVETARRRIAGFKSINPTPDFGPNMTAAIYEGKANAISARLERYNQMLPEVDTELNGIEADEAELNDLNKRFLGATGAQMEPTAASTKRWAGPALANARNQKRKAPAAAHHRRLS